MRRFLLTITGLAIAASGITQEVNFTERYAHPLAISLTFDADFLLGTAPENRATELPEQLSVLGGTAEARMPLPSNPTVQPGVRLGLIALIGPEEEDILDGATVTGTAFDWSNTTFYVAPSIGLHHRASKAFEIGGDLYIGGGLVRYPRRLDTTISNGALIAGVTAGISFSPLYNIGLTLAPFARYRLSFGSGGNEAIDRYDGFYAGIRGGLTFAFGEDPDEGASIRAIRFGQPAIPPLFAAMQSYYATSPVGSVEISNVEDEPITDVEVLFFQAGFMDSPTNAGRIDVMDPGQTRTVDLVATLNERVFDIEGVTPVSGEIIVRYRVRGQAVEQTETVTVDLYDKTSLTWDDDRKMGAFITPADSSIRDYASQISQAARAAEVPGLSRELQYGMQAYHALADRGMLYQPDPTSPFTQVQEQTFLVDSVSLPRDTINRVTGDCDDLTALFNTILESRGIETGFVTTPGHIYSAINLKLPGRDWSRVHADRNMTLVVDDELWILVEITVVGRDSFLEAWRAGMLEYTQYDSDPSVRSFFRTRDAQSVFRPVGLRATTTQPEIDDADAVRDEFVQDRDSLAQVVLGSLRESAEERNRSREWNRYGIAAAELFQFETAERAFLAGGNAEGGSPVIARANIGAMYMVQGQFESAVRALNEAVALFGEEVDPRTSSTVYLNLSQAYTELGELDSAAVAFDKAAEIDPVRAEAFDRDGHVNRDTEGGRASEAEDRRPLFVED